MKATTKSESEKRVRQPAMPAGDAPLVSMEKEIAETNLKSLRACVQDCIDIKKGPYEPAEAERILRTVLEHPAGSAAREAAVKDALRRFIHSGQVVILQHIEGKSSYRNGRTGIVLHDEPDEQGRFTVTLNDFGDDGKIVETWIRVPPTMIKLQVGMVDGLFMDYRFEKAARRAGIPAPKCSPRQPMQSS